MTEPFRVRLRRAFFRYVRNIFVAIDQLANAIAGGDPDWTISAWFGFCAKNSRCRFCKWTCINICWLIDFVDRRHCHGALEADPDEGKHDAWSILLGPHNRWGWALRMLTLAAVLSLSAGIVFAHGEYDWINEGSYRSPTTDELCCGLNDCFQVPESEVVPTAGGYLIKPLNETVPYGQTLISEDGKYWRCQRPDGSRRCFFAPNQGS